MSGDLWLYGTFDGYSGGAVGQASVTYATPTLVVAGEIDKVRCTTDATYYLTSTGELWGAGYNFALGLGPSGHTNGAFVLVDTGVSDIFDTDQYDSHVVYRKGNNYYVLGIIYPAVLTQLGKSTTYNTTPGRITSLDGMDIVTMSGGSGQQMFAVDAAGNAFASLGYPYDQAHLTATVWDTTNSWDDDGIFHLMTGDQWSPNSIATATYERGFIGIKAALGSNAIYAAGERMYDPFPGYVIPAKNAGGARPTAIGGAWGVMGEKISRAYNGLKKIWNGNYTFCYCASDGLYGHNGNVALTGPLAAGSVVWLGICGPTYSASNAFVVGTLDGAIILGQITSGTPPTYSQLMTTADYPALDGTSFVHASSTLFTTRHALVISPAPPPFDFWENAVGVEQNV